MNKKISNIIFNIAYQLFLIIVPIITVPYLARVLGAVNMGKYSYLETMQTLFCSIGLIGLYNYGIREIAYVRDKGRIAISKTFLEITTVRLIMMLVTIFLFILYGNMTRYKFYFMYSLWWVIGNFIDSTWFFNGLEKIKLVIIRNFIIKVISVVLIFACVTSKNDLKTYLLIIGICQIGSSIALIPNIMKEIELCKISIKGVTKHFIPSIKIFLPQIATLIYTQVDKVMIEALSNNIANVTFYDQAEKLIKVPLAIITSINTVLMPNNANLFINNKIDELKKQLNVVIKLVSLIAFPMSFGIASIGFTLIPWYLGSDFIPVGYLMIFLSPIIIAMALSGVSADQYFVATNKTYILTFTYVTTAIVNVIVNLLLIPIFNCYGAAIATVISEFISVTIQLYYLNKFISVKKSLKYSFKYCLYSIIMMIISLSIGIKMGPTPITNIVQITVSILFYFFILFFTKDKTIIVFKDIIISMVKRNNTRGEENNEKG